jgi:hypothetical protein
MWTDVPPEHQITLHYFPESDNIHNYCCENLKSYIVLIKFISPFADNYFKSN